ncbi:DUF445 domain-containing protein [Bacillus sp. FJAT-49736]|uniref:DUF445 domain-containing protein n=1 Tax=Bacillus sp. FJAT-49736 TaxID=2833582 RepID=UPI0032D574E2
MKNKRNSRYLAGFFLIVMALGFFITMPFQNNIIGRLLQGAFEAGVVGGLADWFAVTALFRHPLGIPIPHTALLPNNRQRMTDGIINLVENNWLSKESIQSKVAQVRITEKLLEELEKNVHSKWVSKGIKTISKRMITQINVMQLADVLEREVKAKAYAMDVKVLLGTVIDKSLAGQYDEKAFDYLLVEVEKWISKQSTIEKLGSLAVQLIDNADVDGFVKFAIKSFRNLINEEKLGNIIFKLVTKGIDDLRNSDSKNREVLLTKARAFLEELKENEKVISEINQWKNSFLDKWDAHKQIVTILEDMQEKLISFIESDKFDAMLLPFLTRLLEELKEDQEKRSKIEEWIHRQIMDLVEKNHTKIGNLVRENLDKLDNKKLVELVETNVGKDLQWIRVNGAVCGFIIGLVLTIVKVLI